MSENINESVLDHMSIWMKRTIYLFRPYGFILDKRYQILD